MATLGVTISGAALAMGGKKAEDANQPPINAKSSEEEKFVKCVLFYFLLFCYPLNWMERVDMPT